MKPRITINTTSDGSFHLWLNEAGRDLLVRELQHLSETSDHFHLGPEDADTEVSLRGQLYRNGDKLLEWGKVMFRSDEWDAQHLPHVLDPTVTSDG